MKKFNIPQPVNNIEKLNRKFDIGNNRLKYIRFEKNERTYAIPKKHLYKFFKSISGEIVTMYPDQKPFYNLISKKYKIRKENILLTPGADAAIKYFFDTYVKRGMAVGYLWPTYPMIDVYVKMKNAKSIKIKFDSEFTINIEDLIKKIGKEIKILVITNPNQPTGTIINDNELKIIFAKCKEKKVPLLIDQAYYEFTTKNKIKVEKEIQNNNYIFACRTFSKSYGVAGARIGYMISNKKNINTLFKVKPLSDINCFALKLVEILVKDSSFFKNYIKEIDSSKKILEKFFKKKKIYYIPTNTNFLIIKIENKRKLTSIHKFLLLNKFLVRKNEILFPGKSNKYLRITIGSIKQTKKFTDIFNKALNKL